MIRFENVKYKKILNIPHLDIPKGEITSILGPSGSGKTTLIKLMNQLLSPDSGTIYYKDQPISEISSVILRREVVMLAQQAIIYPGSIADNLLIGLKFSEKELPNPEKLEQVMEDFKLDYSLERSAFDLSGGEQQRLALARVLLMAPEVLLLDEPSSSLDQDTAFFILERTASYIRKSHKTLVLITHSKEIAEKFSDSILDLEQIQEEFYE